MPKFNAKQEFRTFFDQLALKNMIEVELFGADKRVIDETIEQCADFYMVFNSFRYFVPFVIGSVPKSQKFLLEIVPKLDDERFKVLFRMSRNTFGKLLQLIENDECFQYKGNGKRQASVVIQLQIVLYRLGSSTSLARIAFFFGVGDGGTIINYCRRVFSALLKHQKQLIFWPDSDERHAIVSSTFHEMPYCIGYVDGTEIKLSDAPCEDPDSYISRKQIYSIKVQIVADFKLRVRQIIAGYPGSVHDSRIYNQCRLGLNPADYFDDHQYLLADSAYKVTNTVVTPFRVNTRSSGTSSIQKIKKFNKRLSRFRVRVENCIGLIKERFESLKDMKIPLLNENSNIFVNNWIVVCALLNNFIISQNNPADSIRFEEIFNYEDLHEDELNIDEDLNDGENKRTQIMNFLFN